MSDRSSGEYVAVSRTGRGVCARAEKGDATADIINATKTWRIIAPGKMSAPVAEI